MSRRPHDRFQRLRDASDEERSAATRQLGAELFAPDAEHRCILELIGYWCEFRRHVVGRDWADRVVELLGAADFEVRAEACATLALLRVDGAFDACDPLGRALLDAHPRVRQEAAAALGDLDCAAQARALREALGDEDSEVRFEAAFALSGWGDATGQADLVRGLTHAALRPFAIEGLRKLGGSSAIAPLERVARGFSTPWSDRLAAWATLASMGRAEALSRLRRRLARGRREERTYAAYLVGHAQLQAAREDLLALLDDRRTPFRATVVRSLGLLEDPRDDARLESMAGSETEPEDVRLEATEAIARRGRAPNGLPG